MDVERSEREREGRRHPPGWTPEASTFVSLERKIDELESEGKMRELKWKEVMAEERALGAARMEVADNKWKLRLR